MSCSWYLSYPLAVNSADDSLFNNISILYWISLPLLLVPLYLAAATSQSNLKWAVSIATVITLYSISYFYLMIPGSDSQFFRGLTEYLAETKNLSPLQPNHMYYQWPAFFVLTNIVSSVAGFSIQSIEFLLYTIIGFLLATSLHFYASREYKKNGFLLVMVFFISMFYFLNYQCVPFSLALGLMFLMLMLETRPHSISLTITIELLFVGLVLTHAFVPLFFIIYLVFRTILDRSKYYGKLLLFALSLFFIIQLTIAQYAFATNIMVLLSSSNEYSSIIEATAAPVAIPFDEVAQFFSRIVTVASVSVCGLGFILLLIKKKLRNIDKALLLTGVMYSGLGLFFAALGSRALILAFIPVGLGAVWLFESKINRYLKSLFSVFIILSLVLFLFIPLHLSFNNVVHYQTNEAYKAENFLIEHAVWEKYPAIFVYSSVISYIESKVGVYTHLIPYLEEGKTSDILLYTIGLGKDLATQNYTSQQIFEEQSYNLLYNNGFSFIAARPDL